MIMYPEGKPVTPISKLCKSSFSIIRQLLNDSITREPSFGVLVEHNFVSFLSQLEPLFLNQNRKGEVYSEKAIFSRAILKTIYVYSCCASQYHHFDGFDEINSKLPQFESFSDPRIWPLCIDIYSCLVRFPSIALNLSQFIKIAGRAKDLKPYFSVFLEMAKVSPDPQSMIDQGLANIIYRYLVDCPKNDDLDILFQFLLIIGCPNDAEIRESLIDIVSSGTSAQKVGAYFVCCNWSYDNWDMMCEIVFDGFPTILPLLDKPKQCQVLSNLFSIFQSNENIATRVRGNDDIHDGLCEIAEQEPNEEFPAPEIANEMLHQYFE